MEYETPNLMEIELSHTDILTICGSKEVLCPYSLFSYEPTAFSSPE